MKKLFRERRHAHLGWVLLWAGLGGLALSGCGDKPAPTERAAPVASSAPRPRGSGGHARPVMATNPEGPLSPAGAAGAAGDADSKGLLGLWGLMRVEVKGMSVPLPKHFRIRLHFLPGGKLVVHGVKRTMATRKVGTWRVVGGRLLSTLDGRREVRTFTRVGDRLTLTRKLLRKTVWHMKRLPPPTM